MRPLLIVHSQTQMGSTICKYLGNRFEVFCARDLRDCEAKYRDQRFECLLLELGPLLNGGGQLMRLFQGLRRQYGCNRLVVLGGKDLGARLLDAVQAGATEVWQEPLAKEQLKLFYEDLENRARLESELEMLRSFGSGSPAVTRTHSPLVRQLYGQVNSVAVTDSAVLLLGETGVGKGVIARLIHQASPRVKGPFVHVHCGAIPESLIESELFGHERGAFTGATKRKLGRFELAKGGTIFLDEISTITGATQTKLLQVLQEKIMQRVGGESPINTDVRVIAATNQDLWEMSREGRFREDLYYRLNVFPIEVVPLRERLEDIPLLVDNKLKRLEARYQKQIQAVDPEVYQVLQQYKYPGNIRELENILERAYILETGPRLERFSLPHELATPIESPSPFDWRRSLAEVRQQAIEEIEKRYLERLLSRHKGRIKPSADEAGLGTRQLRNLMIKYELHKESFKSKG